MTFYRLIRHEPPGIRRALVTYLTLEEAEDGKRREEAANGLPCTIEGPYTTDD